MDPEVCSMCFEIYSQERKPMIICQDGHSICEDCLKKVDGCPFCRTYFDDFKPILNRSLLQIVEKTQKESKKKNIPFIPLTELDVEPKPFAVGGSAVLFRAKWKGKDVVIKRMMFLNDEKSDQFENELKLAMKVEHPLIIKMYGKTEMDQMIGLVIEFAEQGDLTKQIPKLRFEEQIDYSLQIIEGIRVLHSNSIIHRDLKPENILISNNKPKISDFGISKVREHTMKVTSAIISFRYSAPELLQEGNFYDTSCDIFSLSMILYEIFSKKQPFEKLSPIMIPAKVLQGERPEFPNDFPKDLAELIKKGWNLNPKERCTLNEFQQYLNRRKKETQQKNEDIWNNSLKMNNNLPKIPSKTTTTIPPTVKFVKKTFGIAQYEFQASNPTELSFSLGDELEILSQGQDGWGDAKLKGKAGFVPLNYLDIIEKIVEIIPPSTPKPRIPQKQMDETNQFKLDIQSNNQENEMNQIQGELEINVREKEQQTFPNFIFEISNVDENKSPQIETLKKEIEEVISWPPSRGYPEIPDEIFENKQYNLIEFAQKFFTPPRKNRPVDGRDLIQYEPKEINKPVLLAVSESKNFKQKSAAIEIFKNILCYIGAKGKRTIEEPKFAKRILSKGIEFPEIRDEIYFQLMKQLQAPDIEIQRRCWQLLILICSTFPPSEESENYLKSHIASHLKKSKRIISQLSQYCMLKFITICNLRANKDDFQMPLDELIENISTAPSKSVALFGVSVEEVMWFQRTTDPDTLIPKIIPFLCQAIKDKGGMKTQGIFRVPGRTDEVTQAKSQFDHGIYTYSFKSPNDAASLLKQFFRDLPEPLIPLKFYQQCLTSAGKIEEEEKVLKQLTPVQLTTLIYIIKFLREFNEPEVMNQTGTNLANLALVFAPNLLRSGSVTFKKVTLNQPKEQLFLLILLKSLEISKFEK
ncbi:rho gtpase activation protein [Anaeramoeba ignava]|uniref:Rho gtpase activation protein n=1 Tax=Anaeramoeba ignava TaxID=1746090 RepID=A0A9Q0REA6_ANAIG|nr:rho gtpase activation protein [Anaeramoeba ignava]